MILETCLTILTMAERATKLYDWFSGARFGQSANATLATIRRDDPRIVQISDQVFVDTGRSEIRSPSSLVVADHRLMRSLMEPLAASTGAPILASQILTTPARLRSAFEKNPWDVLDNIRPFDRTAPDPRPDWVPIRFYDQGIDYIGWQKRGALPSLFDCDFDPTHFDNIEVARDFHSASPVVGRGVPSAISSGAPVKPLLGRPVLLTILKRFRTGREFAVLPDLPKAWLANVQRAGVSRSSTLAIINTGATGGISGSFLAFTDTMMVWKQWDGLSPSRFRYRDLVRLELLPYGGVLVNGSVLNPSLRTSLSPEHFLELLISLRDAAHKA